MRPARLPWPLLVLVAVLAQAGLGAAAACCLPDGSPSATPTAATTTAAAVAAPAAATTGTEPGGPACTEHRPCHRAPGPDAGGRSVDGVLRTAGHGEHPVPAVPAAGRPADLAAAPRAPSSTPRSGPAVPPPAVRAPVAVLGVDRN